MKHLLLLVLILTISGCVSVDLRSLFSPQLEEHVIQEGESRRAEKILVVDISGLIASGTGSSPFFLNRSNPEQIKALLNKAEKDPKISAVILRIDTPGGEVTATDMIYHEIMEFKKRSTLPVVASMMGLACSGGYYIACAADEIYAHPTSITGSVGIIARFPNLEGLANKIGYREEILATGKMKSMGHPLREMTPEIREVFRGTIDGLYQRFLEVVKNSRPTFVTIDGVEEIADGRIYTAQQALDLGLIDEIAYLSEVVENIKIKHGIGDAQVISYKRLGNSDLNIYSRSFAERKLPVTLVNLDFNSFLPKNRAGFYYLWSPGGSSN